MEFIWGVGLVISVIFTALCWLSKDKLIQIQMMSIAFIGAIMMIVSSIAIFFRGIIR